MIWGIQDQDAGKKQKNQIIHHVSLSSVVLVISCIFMYYIHTYIFSYLHAYVRIIIHTVKTKVVKHGD